MTGLSRTDSNLLDNEQRSLLGKKVLLRRRVNNIYLYFSCKYIGIDKKIRLIIEPIISPNLNHIIEDIIKQKIAIINLRNTIKILLTISII